MLCFAVAPRRMGSLRKRSAAATRFLRVRVLEHEPLVHQGLLVIQNHAVQINERLRIDEDANVFELKNTIAFARLRVEADVVTQSGTATTLDTQAKPAFGRRDIFFRQRRTDTSYRLLGHLDTVGGGGGRFGRILDIDWAHGPVPCTTPSGATPPVLSNQFTPSVRPKRYAPGSASHHFSSSSHRSRRESRLPPVPSSGSSPEAATAPSQCPCS